METFLTKIAGQTVLIRNKVSFQHKLRKFVRDGPSKLNVVSDFDYTMTRFNMPSGQRGFSCHRVIEECGLLGSDYEVKAMALQQKYYPIEIDPLVSHDEKVSHMLAWVTAAHALLLNSDLTRRALKQAVIKACKDQKVKLRSGVDIFMNSLLENEVPMLVFSAGIADILEQIILSEMNREEIHSNVYVVSNRMLFGPKPKQSAVEAAVALDTQECSNENENIVVNITGIDEREAVDNSSIVDDVHNAVDPNVMGEVIDDYLVGFTQPEFHVLNKRASEVTQPGHPHHAFFQQPEYLARSNLILIGDSLGDCLMHQGLHHRDSDIIKIAYLNARPERLDQFLEEEHFDMAILGDQGFDVPFELLTAIVHQALSGDLAVFDDPFEVQ